MQLVSPPPCPVVPLTCALVCVLAASVAKDGAQDGAREATASAARVRDVRDLSALLEREREGEDLIGLAAVVVTSDGVVARGAAGVRVAGGDTAVTEGDLWHLGSCTKAMTAVLVARMVDAEELAFDTEFADAAPDALPEDGANEAYDGLTLLELVHHRSGFGSEFDDRALWAELWRREGTPVEQRRRLARAMLAKEPAVVRGTYRYSNANYALAGHACEVVADTPWEELVESRVFAPLHITTAGQGVPWVGTPPTQPFGHGADGEPVPPGPFADNPPAIAPGGTVHMSIDDWAKFVRAVLRGARGEDDEFLHRGTWETLLEPVPFGKGGDGYACGWIVTTRPWAKGDGEGDTGRVLTHTGTNNSWVATCWIAPERDFAVLVTTNRGGGDATQRVDRVVGAVLMDHLAAGDGR
ncbi:MAG: serine hydrolase domain-containing protein [Planctomycetota bacterium]